MKAPIPKPRKALYEFGSFRLEPARHLLRRDATPLPLPPKAFEILVLLVGRPGELLTKAELLSAVWPDTFVEENNLTQYVSMLRKVLGDGVDDQKYIETVPKLGYRFVFDVREIADAGGDLILARQTQTRIVVRQEQEEEISDADSVSPSAAHAAASLPATTTTGRHAWRWPVICTLVVLAAAVVLAYPRYLRPHRAEHPSAPVPIAIKPRPSVAVMDLRNLSGRPDESWLSAALAQMLTTELAAGGQLRLASREDITQMKADLKLADTESLGKTTLSQVRKRLGVDITVAGSFVELGHDATKRIRLDLRVQDANSGETLASIAEAGTVEELFRLVSRTGAELRAKLGAPAVTGSEEGELQAALPSTPEAERLYSQGLSKLRSFDAVEAQRLLAKAVTEDPNYALGHSALAAAWSALGYDERAKTEAKRALDLSENLSRQDRLSIVGRYHELTRDWDKAVATYQLLYSLFPDSLDYGLRLAGTQTSAGKGKDAIATLEKLRKLPPLLSQDPRIDIYEASAAESLGNFNQERDAAQRAARSGEILGEQLTVARSRSRESWALIHLGQTAEGIAVLQEGKKLFSATGDADGVISTLRIMANALRKQGDFAQAEKNYQEAIALARRTSDRRNLALALNDVATMRYERSDFRGAKALYQQSLAIEREVGSKVNTAGALGNLANVVETMGDLAEARSLNEESLKIFEEVGDQRAMGTGLGNLAEVLYEQGDLAGAKKDFAAAMEIKKKIGYRRGIAYDLSGLGEVLRAEGDLVAARQKHEQALAIRKEIGEKMNAVVSQLNLANLALEEQHPADAEKLARETAEEFKKAASEADEAQARIALARAFLAQGKAADAQAAINRATALSSKIPDLPLHFDVAITAARISVLGKTPVNRAAVAQAEKSLEESLATALKYGFLEYQLKLRLALAEIEIKSGNTRQARARLGALGDNAKAKGFGLIARNATALEDQ